MITNWLIVLVIIIIKTRNQSTAQTKSIWLMTLSNSDNLSIPHNSTNNPQPKTSKKPAFSVKPPMLTSPIPIDSYNHPTRLTLPNATAPNAQSSMSNLPSIKLCTRLWLIRIRPSPNRHLIIRISLIPVFLRRNSRLKVSYRTFILIWEIAKEATLQDGRLKDKAVRSFHMLRIRL